MLLRLEGPSEDHTTHHTMDAGTAAFLAIQLAQRHTFVQPNGVTQETPPIDITIDGEKLRVKRATIEFWTKGEVFEGEAVLELEDR